MQRLEVSGAVRPIYGSLGVKRFKKKKVSHELRPRRTPSVTAVSRDTLQSITCSSWKRGISITHKYSLPVHFYRTWGVKSRNACYHSVQNLLSSGLLSKNLEIKSYRTIILPVVLNGCETWSLTLREERRLRVFENRVLRKITGPRRVR